MPPRAVAVLAIALLTTTGLVWHQFTANAGGRGNASVLDRDHDGLDDRLEASLAASHLPAIHEYFAGTAQDECLEPRRRPILFRARPRGSQAGIDRAAIAITYVLLYAKDCGALGHDGDAEAFTVFLQLDHPEDWRTVGALAVAHEGTAAERRSFGSGLEIWVSRNKHANYATFDACLEGDIGVDECARAGPLPPSYLLLNVGEPSARLSDDVGDVAPMFRGRRIWNHEPFLGAGDLTAKLFLRVSPPSTLQWAAELPSTPLRKDDP